MKTEVAKRLSFIVKEDFNFLTYLLLITLDSFVSQGSIFKSHRKLTHLMQFVSDSRLVGVVERYEGRLIDNVLDRELMFSAFVNGELHRYEIFKLLMTLSNRGYVELVRTSVDEFDVIYKPLDVPKGFSMSPIFSEERANALNLRKLIPRLSSMGYEKFMARLYEDRGVRAWRT